MSERRNGKWVVAVILGAVFAVSFVAWIIFMRVQADRGKPLPPESAAESAGA